MTDALIIIMVFAALLVVLIDVNVWFYRLPKHGRQLDDEEKM